MFHECFYHKPRSNWAYAYNSDTIHLRVQTKKNDVENVVAVTGDKYDWEHLQEDIPMIKTATDHYFDYWMAAVKPAFKRFSYCFRLTGGEETVYLTESGVSAVQPEPSGGYFEYPYIHEIDLFSAPQWAREAVFYQILPDRYQKGKIGNERQGLAPWGAKPTADRFFGGDLEGILSRLDHLSELGITAIYMTPIFESPSSHKYDTVDYRKVDSHFGDKEWLKLLVQACHERRIRVVLDAVFNHTSEHFPPFRDVVKHGEQSRYKDWFHIRGYPLKENGRTNYETFGFFDHMPKLNTAHPEVKSYLLEVAEYWIKEADIDGWRLDVANEVDHQFWREFRQRVKAAKPDAYLIGEVWSDSMMWLLGDQFDSVMNYPFADTAMDFFASEGKTDGLRFAEHINTLLIRYPQQTNEVIFNLLSSHDTPRVLTRVEGDKNRLKLAVVFLMTYIGTPCIFYGDEIGLQGGDDPDCRGCMIWERQEQDRELFDFYKLLIGLRKSHEVLRSGSFRFLKAQPDDRRIIYERLGNGRHFTIWMNNTEERTVMEHPVPEGDWADALSGEAVAVEESMQKVALEPFGYRILSRLL